MKKFSKTLLAGVLAASALFATAAAADFDHCADKLKDLGLFQGTSTGYELDRAPTRGEAATMLVRLLGKEAEAKALTYDAPFTDLDDWQKPYVQYLYTNNLTNGATETTFEPEDKCSAQMYTTFLLRALSYSDAQGGDFSYDKALAFGQSIGLVDYANCDAKNFLRDHVAAMSYTALICPPKGAEDQVLLEKLVADGAVDKAKAAPVLDAMNAYVDYIAASEVASLQTKMDMDAVTNMVIKMNGEKAMTMQTSMNIKADMNLEAMDQSKMAVTGTTKLELAPALVPEGAENTAEMDTSAYYTNGEYYYSTSDGEKTKIMMSFENALEPLNGMGDLTVTPISIIRSISKSGNTYTVDYAGSAMGSMVQDVIASMAGAMPEGVADDFDSMDMKFGDMTAKMTMQDGKPTSMDMTLSYEMTVEGQTVSAEMKMTSKYNAFGDSVKVVLPENLSEYKDMPAAA